MKAGMLLRCIVVAVVCCTMMVGCKKGCRNRGGATPETGIGTQGTTGFSDVERDMPARGDIGAEDRTTLQAQTLYFAYDSAAINPHEHSKLQAVADWLRSNPGKHILIEGHCDERGTTEYNRALGERRALAAREALIGLNVNPSDLQTISYGEDKPASPGHDESAWSQNRRAEFVIIQ